MKEENKARGIARRHLRNAANQLHEAGEPEALRVVLALDNCLGYGSDTYGLQLAGAVQDFIASEQE